MCSHAEPNWHNRNCTVKTVLYGCYNEEGRVHGTERVYADYWTADGRGSEAQLTRDGAPTAMRAESEDRLYPSRRLTDAMRPTEARLRRRFDPSDPSGVALSQSAVERCWRRLLRGHLARTTQGTCVLKRGNKGSYCYSCDNTYSVRSTLHAVLRIRSRSSKH